MSGASRHREAMASMFLSGKMSESRAVGLEFGIVRIRQGCGGYSEFAQIVTICLGLVECGSDEGVFSKCINRFYRGGNFYAVAAR